MGMGEPDATNSMQRKVVRLLFLLKLLVDGIQRVLAANKVLLVTSIRNAEINLRRHDGGGIVACNCYVDKSAKQSSIMMAGSFCEMLVKDLHALSMSWALSSFFI